jgi:hypothetical protein
MKINSLLLTFIAFLLFSCSSQKGKNSKIKQINITDKIKEFSQNDLELQVLKLQDTEDNLIGKIDKLIVNNGIYILDSRLSKSLYKFDMDGKLLFKISDVGSGPGEFYLPFDFDISDSEIFILDLNQRKILSYDLNDGEFISELRYDFQTMSFAHIKEDIFAFHVDGREFENDLKQPLFWQLDLVENKIIQEAVLEYPHTDYLSTQFDFHRNNGTLIFSKAMHDTVYTIMNNKMVPLFSLSFKQNKPISDEVKSKDMIQARESIINNGLHYHNGGFIKSNNKLLFSWLDEQEQYVGCYDLKSEEFYNLKFTDLPISKVFTNDNNRFVTSAFGYEFDKSSKYYSDTDYVNPYIIFFSFKE